MSELSARTNDEGWNFIFSKWLKTSNLNDKDALMIFSVGGGSKEKKISEKLIHAVDYAKELGCSILGIVGKSNGYVSSPLLICIFLNDP